MNRDDFEWKIEEEWLKDVLVEIHKQYDKNRDFKEKLKRMQLGRKRSYGMK